MSQPNTLPEENDDLTGSKLPSESQKNANERKGIDLFFGEAEASFFDQVGKEMTINILKESFILFRVDLKKTKTHSLYGEAIVKEYKDPIEIFGRISVETDDPHYRTQKGVVKQGMGQLTASLHLSHLKDIGLLKGEGNNLTLDMKKGDFLQFKSQTYEIWDDGYSQLTNNFYYAGDRRAFLRIRAKEVDRDVFNGA